jgi:hypothetical protein
MITSASTLTLVISLAAASGAGPTAPPKLTGGHHDATTVGAAKSTAPSSRPRAAKKPTTPTTRSQKPTSAPRARAAAPSSTPDAGPWLVQVGWDAMTPAALNRRASALQGLPFDGVVLELASMREGGNQVFTTEPLDNALVSEDRAALVASASGPMQHNFLRLNSAGERGFDWCDNTDWSAAADRIRTMADLVAGADSAVDGVFFDSEPYGVNLWRYADQPCAASKSFEEMETVLYARGQDLMVTLQSADPGIAVISGGLFSGLKDGAWLDPTSTPSDVRAPLMSSDYGLIAAFYAGMVDATRGSTTLHDGNQFGYYALNSPDFFTGQERALVERNARKIAPTLDPARYQASYRHSYPVYADLVLDLFGRNGDCGGGQWCGQWPPHYLSESDRLLLLQRQVYDALSGSDNYAWMYSEEINWRGGVALAPAGTTLDAAPSGAEDAITRAVERFRAGQPLGVDVTAALTAARQACARAGGTNC